MVLVRSILAVLCLSWSLPVWAATASECDRLAADPLDPASVSGGIAIEAIDADTAIEACLAAVEADPDNPTLHFQLARALTAKEEFDGAIEHLEAALDAEYPPAAAQLARFYIELIVSTFDRQHDLERALTLFQLAKDGGYKLDLDEEFAAWEEYYSIAFVSDGYKQPAMMDAVWAGDDSLPDTPEARSALMVFLENYEEICIDPETAEEGDVDGSIGNSPTVQFLDITLKSLADNPSIPDDWKWYIKTKFLMNREAILRGSRLGIRARAHDAMLFIDRHDCHSDVADTFLENAYQKYTLLFENPEYRHELGMFMMSAAAYFLDRHPNEVGGRRDLFNDFIRGFLFE